MLAYQEEDIFSALKRTGFPVICDFKIDGVRIIVHRKGDYVRIFSRKLREIVLEIKRFPYNEFIIDGELIVESESGKPFPFQDIISLISRGSNLFSTWKVKPFFFDVLKLGNEEIWKKPAIERREILERIVPSNFVVPWIMAEKGEEVSEWMEESIKS